MEPVVVFKAYLYNSERLRKNIFAHIITSEEHIKIRTTMERVKDTK